MVGQKDERAFHHQSAGHEFFPPSGYPFRPIQMTGAKMVKVIALYRKPADAKDFDDQYFNTHLPLANKLPGLKKLEVARVTGTPAGESEYHLMAELYFDSMEDLKNAMASPEGKASTKNLMSFAKDVTYVMFADVEKVPATV